MLNKLFIIVLASLTLSQFSDISFLFGGGVQKIYLFDLLVGLYTFVGIFQYLIKKEKIVIPRNIVLFLVFTIIAAASLIPVYSKNSGEDLLFAFFYLVRWVVYLLSGVVTFSAVKNKYLDVAKLFKYFVISGVILSVLGFAQLIILPDFTVLDPSLGWDPHKNRLASTFFDPNFLGAYLVLCITVLLFKREIFSKRLFRAVFAISLLALFLTYSRSAWGMFAVVIFIYGLKKSVFIIFAALILIFSAYFAIPRIQTRLAGLTDPADSAHFRLISWRNTFEIVEDNLILGVGFNNLKAEKVNYGYLTPDTLEDHSASGSDSSFLLVLATTGIIGFIIFILAFFFPLLSAPSYFTAAIIFSFILESQFINSLFFPQIMFFWISLYALIDS